MEPIIGRCSKHPAHNFVNCPMCNIEQMQKESKSAAPLVDGGEVKVWAEISVSERLPEHGQKVVTLYKDGRIETNTYLTHQKKSWKTWFTHWLEQVTASPSDSGVDAVVFKKQDWDNFKLQMGNRCYQGLINIEDFADIISQLEEIKNKKSWKQNT